MAMVGAYVLAGELAGRGRRPCARLSRHEAVMREFVNRCQKFALSGVDFHLPRSRARMWVVNQSMRMPPYTARGHRRGNPEDGEHRHAQGLRRRLTRISWS